MNTTQIIGFILLVIVINYLWGIRSSNQQKHLQQESIEQQPVDIKKSSTLTQKIVPSVILLFPLFMGLIGLNKWFTDYNIAKATTNWDMSSGIIKDKKILTYETTGKNQLGNSTTVITYKAQIKYTSKDGNKIYTYNKIDYLNKPYTSDQAEVQDELNQYPIVGEEITIYTKPDKSDAVILKGVSGMSYLLVVGSGIFAMLGLFGLKGIWL